MTLRMLVSSSLLLSVVACGDDDGSAPLVAERFAQTYCHIIQTCYHADTAENFVAMLARAVPASECETFVARVVLGSRDIDGAIAAGTYTVDAARLDACIDELEASCGLENPASCNEAFDGKAAIGGACTYQEDCAGDAYCDTSECAPTCIARKARGAACDADHACSTAAGPTACSYESNTCVPVVYSAGAALGAPCGPLDDGAKITQVQCGAGLACDANADGDPVCVAPVAAGGACEDDHTPCAKGTICMPDAGSDGGVCGTLTVADAVGATCNEDFDAADFKLCNPVKLLGCIAGKCAQIGDGSVGATCFTTLDISGQCDVGAYCDEATNKCAAAKADGATCTSSDECQSDYCNYTSSDAGVCATPQCGT